MVAYLLAVYLIFCSYLQDVYTTSFDSHAGHLKPLGNQRPPSVDIDEFTPETAPTPQRFYEDYVKPSKAAIFRNAMVETPAFKLWTDEYLKEHYGDLEVRLEGKKEKVHATPIGEKYMGRDTIGHFADTYHAPDSYAYIVSELPKQMFHEVGILPSLGACGDMRKSFVEIDLWWSSGGSKSVIHKDAFNQINCLHRGTKYWKLFEFKYEKWLYKHWENENEIGGFSDINIDAVDLLRHPNMLKVPWSNFTINAGDCLFLPKSYYHQVDSDGPFNLAVSILFSRFDYVPPKDFSDCNADTEYIIPKPLSSAPVMWQWPGKGVMSMGYGDFEESYRVPLLETAEKLRKKGMNFTFEVLQMLFADDLSRRTDLLESFKEAVNVFDTDGDLMISVNELKNATFDQLRAYGWLTEVYEPSNNYEFEYSFLPYSDVKQLLTSTIRINPVLTRDKWIEVYQDYLRGTKAFADEIYTGLVQSSTKASVETKAVTSADIERALANWMKFYAPQYASDDDELTKEKLENEIDDDTNDLEVDVKDEL